MKQKRRGEGTVYQRGNIYWIAFVRDGKRISKSCGQSCTSESQARTKLLNEMRKSADDFVEPRLLRVSIGDLIKNLLLHYDSEGLSDFKDATKVKWDTYLAPVFKDLKASAFSTTHQMEYRTKRAGEGAANATINRELQILRRAFKLGFRHEPPLVRRVPYFKITREDNARKGFVSPSQLDALRAAAKAEGLAYALLLEMAFVLGWRKGELLGLHVSNVRLADGTVRLEAHETKNKKPREVPLTSALRILIEPFVLGRKPAERVFPFVGIQKAWARITANAGCPEILFHDLRRSAARAKRSAGVDSSIIMEMQGWRTDTMFRRYGIVAVEDKAVALAKLEAYEKAIRENVPAAPSPVLQSRYTGSEN